MTSRKEKPDLSNMDKYVLDALLKNLPQDKIWLHTFENRLRKLERKGYVKKDGNFWSLTEFGRMCAVMQEGPLSKGQ